MNDGKMVIATGDSEKGTKMAITLNPELDRRVQEKLATGLYESVEHVLSAALSLWW